MNIDELIKEGNILFRNNSFKEAIIYYEKAIEINPTHIIAWNNKGRAFYKLGNFKEAVECYNRGLIYDPGNFQLSNNKSIALENLKKETLKGLKKRSEKNLLNVDSLIKNLKNGNTSVKIESAWNLGKSNDSNAVRPLIESLNDKEVNSVCVINLVKLRNFSLDPLIESLNRDEKLIRRGAVEVLGDINDKKALDPLTNMLTDTDWNVRFKTIIALGKFGDDNLIEFILPCLNDKTVRVKSKAAEVIGILASGEKVYTMDELEELRRKEIEEIILKRKEELKSQNINNLIG